jgi:hypothetical protein
VYNIVLVLADKITSMAGFTEFINQVIHKPSLVDKAVH